MIDLETESIMPLESARKWLGEKLGVAPSKVAMRRWITSGIKGIVLDSSLVGGRRYVSKEGINRFIAATSGAPVVVPSARRRREMEAAGREADRIFGTAKGGGR